MVRLKALLLIAIAATPLLILGLPQHFIGRYQGSAAANHDYETGKFRLRMGGRRTPAHRTFEKIAAERFGLEVINTGCVPTDYGLGFNAAYNKLMLGKLHKRGVNLDREALWAEATKLAASQ